MPPIHKKKNVTPVKRTKKKAKKPAKRPRKR